MARKTADMQLLGDTLTRQYRLACELYNTFPVGRTTHQLSQGNLLTDLSTVDHDHMEALCHLLQNKVTPQTLKFSIPTSEEVGVKLLQQAVRGISLCISQSYTLASLELSNVKLRGNNLELLCQGLSKSRNLKILSFSSCSLHDTGVERLCQSIKNVPSISNLSLIDCCISEKGALMTAGLLKHQRLNRDSAMWQDTLRLRHPHLDGMRGLRRITLNYNPQLGDFGAKALAEVLLEDLWIKALDLQHCGIGEEGGLALKKMLKTNHTIEVLDLRMNPFIPSQIVNEVISLLHERQEEYNTKQYTWLNAESDQNIDKENEIKMKSPTRLHTSTKKTTLKENAQKPYPKSQPSVKKVPVLPKKSGIPWRVEYRLYERKEGLKPGSFIDSLLRSDRSTSVAPQDSELSSEKTTIDLRKIKKLLNHYRHLYRKEKEARKRIEHKLSKLQAKMNKCHLLDDLTVNHIETCFQRFQTFLLNLKTTGFHWQAELWEDASKPKQMNVLLQDSNSSPPLSSLQESEYNFANVASQAEIELLNFSSANLPIIFRNRKISSKGYQENVPEPVNLVSTPENHVKLSTNIPEKENGVENAAHQVYDENIIDSLQKDLDTGKMLVSSFINSCEKHEEESRINENTNDSQHDVHENKELPVPVQPVIEIASSSAEDQDSEAHSVDIRDDYARNIHNQEVLEPERNSSKIKSEDVLETNNRHSDIQTEQAIVIASNQVPSEEEVSAIQAEKDIQSNTSEIATDNNSKFMKEKINHNITPERYVDNSPKFMKDLTFFSPHKTDKHMHKLESDPPNENSSKFSLQTGSGNIHSESIDASIKEPENRDIKNKDDSVAATENNSETVDGPPYSQRSETDDEKLQMKKAIRQAPRSGSVSSVSITEHLSNSHSSWTKLGKNRVKKTVKYESTKSKTPAPGLVDSKKVESTSPKDIPMEYDSDFEVSDVEGLSISASSLTSTTIPDDLVTPGEEEF
ncbi:uncharacterized protein LOC135207485 [Macrobrachium nipponense]|uniref:uncharacterized protein LOC135207485 n=1 Tax=Macrobrachium nipponense TaxID=159736 RepID=UPI0030C8324E